MKITEESLLESRSLRNGYIGKTEVLNKVKDLIFLQNTELMTVEQVAKYYQVTEDAVKWHLRNNKDELKADGLRILKKKTGLDELKALMKNGKESNSLPSNILNSSILTVIPRRAILRIGMLLRDSEIAKQVRSYLLDVEEKSTHRLFIDFCNDYGFDIDVRKTTMTYYYHARNLMRSMGYSDNTTDLLRDFFNPSEKKKFGNAWYVSETGLRRFCTGHKRKKMVHILAKHLGVESFMSPVEVDIAYALQKAFPELTIVEKKKIEGNPEEIDIYVEELKLAIEVDENGHAGYDEANELRRQKMFEDALGCKFERYNPNKGGFTVGMIVADIRRLLRESFLVCPHCKAVCP